MIYIQRVSLQFSRELFHGSFAFYGKAMHVDELALRANKGSTILALGERFASRALAGETKLRVLIVRELFSPRFHLDGDGIVDFISEPLQMQLGDSYSVTVYSNIKMLYQSQQISVLVLSYRSRSWPFTCVET